MRQLLIADIVVEAVNIAFNSLIVRCEACISTIGRQDFIVAYALQDIVEATELIVSIGEIVLNRFTRECIEV